MKRIEFTLSMPGSPSWNGKWSGEGRHWAIVKKMTDREAKKVLGSDAPGTKRYWTHHWDDGWCAGITASVMLPGEKAKKSAGFCGYDWMVSNILTHGSTREGSVRRIGR